MSDFERRVQQLVVERVDAELGPRRPPPPFDAQVDEVYPLAGRLQRLTSRPVLLALVAAACIVVILVGSIGLSQLSADRPTPPAVPSPSPTPSVTSTSAPTTAAQPAAPTSGVAPAAGPTVTLAGARVTLPPGWVARPMARYEVGGASAYGGQDVWCLTPASAPVSTARYACPIGFSPLDSTLNVDTDIEGGYAADPQYCPDFSSPSTVQVAVRSFGGRSADYRLWQIACRDGSSYRIEQYVVPTGPGYSLISEVPGTAVDGVSSDVIAAAMTTIAAQSILPAQSAPIRLYDNGYVRSLQQVAGGLEVRIDRVVPAEDDKGWVNNSPMTYRYVISTATLTQWGAAQIKVGVRLVIFSDGHRVVAFETG